MAETEVSKMVSTEGECVLDVISSHRDLPKSVCNGSSHHGQASDLDDSYVSVTGADGLHDGAVGGKDVVVGGSSVPSEPEGCHNEDAGHLNEGVNGNVVLSNGDYKPVSCGTCENESFYEDGEGVQVSVADSPVVQACEIERSLEDEVKQVSVADFHEVHPEVTQSLAEGDDERVEDSNGKTASESEAPVEKDVDQNGEIEGMVDGQREDFDGVAIMEPPPFPFENQESQVRALESNNDSNCPIDGDYQSNISVTEEALEAQERSEAAIVDADEHELRSVSVEAEAKSTRELAEAAEHEVSTSTSPGSESFANGDRDKTLKEEAKKDLSLDVVENQLGENGAINTVQDMVGEIDESKPVGNGSDSHVQTTCGSALEEENESLPVFEVENGTQYLEESREQSEGSSSDSHGQTTGGLILEEKNEDSFVSEVENGSRYHDESQEQPVGSSNDSHALTTCDLVLEEKVEESCVSEVNNGAQYHEESQEQPVGGSIDAHVQTTDGLVLEEKNDDSSVAVVENGGEHHEGSGEQPVVSTTDSQKQTTCDLASVGSNEVSSLSKVENGTHYDEETQVEPVLSSTCDLVLEEKDEESCVSEVENGSKHPEESQEQSDGFGASPDTSLSENITEVSVQSQSNPAPNDCAPPNGTEVSGVEEIASTSPPPIVGPESQTIEKVVPGHDSAIKCTPDEASSGYDCALDMAYEKEIAFEGCGQAHSETEVSSGKSEVGDSSPEIDDVKLEPDSHVHDFSVRISEEKSDDLAVPCRADISDSFNLNSDAVADIEEDGVEDVVDKLYGTAGSSKKIQFLQENENTGNSQNEETSVASAGVSTINATDGEDQSIKTEIKPFNFLIRIPRFDDEDLREQIRLAKLQVDEKTKLRDAIQHQIQEKRANSQNNGIDYEYSKGEVRSGRKLVKSKRMEIDSLQSVINKAKNALSIEDIDSQIRNMEHMIQHETLPLKEEKLLIREIKQLNQLREQLSSNMGSQEEIKQALEQREETEERLKILRKELDILKNSVLKAEATASEADKKYDDENRKVKELQSQFRAADEVRQAAYAHWQNLRKELSKMNEYFFKYKDDATVAGNYAFNRDTEALYRLCTNQVGSFMELWNTNPEFRRDYVKFNARSNIRRFGTLDCRSLGPDEQPPAKPSYTDARSNRMTSTPAAVDQAPRVPSVELKQKTPSENVISNGKSIEKVMERNGPKVLNGPAINVQVNGFGAHTRSDIADEVHEEPIKSRDEIELMRKAEAIRKEKVEAELKERRRLEALEKANEARERKKKQAEKLQQRAELKAQKEAEQREKEREKRLRKKERKKAGVVDSDDTNNKSESTAENSKDVDVKEVPPASAAKKPWLAAKQQSKTKSIPPPLRNRNKKKLQQWMWVGITCLFILVLFWLGNMGVFSHVALKRRAPAH